MQHKPKLRIQELIDPYEAKIQDFYGSFYLKFDAYYKTDIEAVSALWRRWNDPSSE